MSLSGSRTVAGVNAACFRPSGAGFGFRDFTSPASHRSVLSLCTETFARVGPRETSSPEREARSYLNGKRQVLRPYRGGTEMKILVSGSSGLVGSALVPLLSTRGHSITRLVRQDPQPGQGHWDPERGTIEADRLA